VENNKSHNCVTAVETSSEASKMLEECKRLCKSAKSLINKSRAIVDSCKQDEFDIA